MKTNEELTLELKCARCGRKLGVYTGKTFYILGLDAEAKIVCEECYIEGFGARVRKEADRLILEVCRGIDIKRFQKEERIGDA